MKEAFRRHRFQPAALETIERINEVIDEAETDGLTLTGRQLYYQFVTKNWLANTPRSYKNLLSTLAAARYAGLVDWDAIEDRVRQPQSAPDWSSIDVLIEAALEQFRLPRWKDQENYCELWVEKDALAGVLLPLAREHHVTLMVNKGYSSASAMYEAASRIAEGTDSGRKRPIVFYLGDHDPSGEDMVRDIGARLNEFSQLDDQIEVQKLALTRAQVEEYDPPPNPAKRTDSRFKRYRAKHGTQSWEVDALPPRVLARIVRAAFSSVMDRPAYDAIVAQEARDSGAMRAALKKLAPKGRKGRRT